MTLTAPHDAETPTRWDRVRPPVVLAAVLLGLSVLLHFRDPHKSGSWGYCPWFLLTGTYCPGCGGLRAVNDLTRGDVAAAASSNLMFVSSLPILGLLWVRSVGQRWRGVRKPLSPTFVKVTATAAVVLIAVFAVVRNLPFGAWLAP